jgi:hypothetical protein
VTHRDLAPERGQARVHDAHRVPRHQDPSRELPARALGPPCMIAAATSDGACRRLMTSGSVSGDRPKRSSRAPAARGADPVTHRRDSKRPGRRSSSRIIRASLASERVPMTLRTFTSATSWDAGGTPGPARGAGYRARDPGTAPSASAPVASVLGSAYTISAVKNR